MARKLRSIYQITPLQIVADAYPTDDAAPEGWDVIEDDVQNQDLLSLRIFDAIATQLPNELMTVQISLDKGGVWQVYVAEDELIPAPQGAWVAQTQLPGYASDASWVNDSAQVASRINLDAITSALIAECAERDAVEQQAALQERAGRVAEYRREMGIVDA